MKKIVDFTVVVNERLGEAYARLTLKPVDSECRLTGIMPGQFMQVSVDAPGVFLRRPISINDFDSEENTVTMLVRKAGKGTATLIEKKPGDVINVMLPLGNGFTVDDVSGKNLLLIGGGVGVAPLLYLGKYLNSRGIRPTFLLGARSAADLLEIGDFRECGQVEVSTEDGSAGEKGLVTAHTVLDGKFDRIYCCGPMPMMKAVARIARERACDCEVSLENVMACGLGACLCCVENTVKGNVCVCTEGPVFNISQLNWE